KIFADDKTRFTALCTGKWKADTPFNRKTAEVTKRLFQYWPPGSTTLKGADIEQLFLSQKAALWQGTPTTQGQTILRRIDEAKADAGDPGDLRQAVVRPADQPERQAGRPAPAALLQEQEPALPGVLVLRQPPGLDPQLPGLPARPEGPRRLHQGRAGGDARLDA